jgi:hypothetical protein
MTKRELKEIIKKWPLVAVVFDYSGPEISFWSSKKSKDGELLEVDKKIGTLNLEGLLKFPIFNDEDEV